MAHKAKVACTDLHANGKHARQGKEGGVLIDVLEHRLLGSNEVREKASVGSGRFQPELVEPRAKGGVVERAEDGAAVERDLGAYIGSAVKSA